jgi:hypothetical protein
LLPGPGPRAIERTSSMAIIKSKRHRARRQRRVHKWEIGLVATNQGGHGHGPRGAVGRVPDQVGKPSRCCASVASALGTPPFVRLAEDEGGGGRTERWQTGRAGKAYVRRAGAHGVTWRSVRIVSHMEDVDSAYGGGGTDVTSDGDPVTPSISAGVS